MIRRDLRRKISLKNFVKLPKRKPPDGAHRDSIVKPPVHHHRPPARELTPGAAVHVVRKVAFSLEGGNEYEPRERLRTGTPHPGEWYWKEGELGDDSHGQNTVRFQPLNSLSLSPS